MGRFLDARCISGKGWDVPCPPRPKKGAAPKLTHMGSGVARTRQADTTYGVWRRPGTSPNTVWRWWLTPNVWSMARLIVLVWGRIAILERSTSPWNRT